jgi:hypothetical protein
MTARKTILQVLHALLQTQPAPALRGKVLPERIPTTGLLISVPAIWVSLPSSSGRWPYPSLLTSDQD